MVQEATALAASSPDLGNARLARFVWETHYRYQSGVSSESSLEDTWQRVADAVAGVEAQPHAWHEPFLEIMRGFRFLPAGRILAGAGTAHQVTLCNCFVMGRLEDSIEGIFEALKEGALTMQQGGGVGYDFSTLRPRGSHARTTGMTASGPVSFMHVWDAMCATILSTGARRGAMMATLRCDHPDIEEFIAAKLTPGVLEHFNLSVLVSDAFMQAVHDDADWPLLFPARDLAEAGAAGSGEVQRCWSDSTVPVVCRVHRTMRARALWRKLCDCAYERAEPGVLFIDRINAMNNLGYCEQLTASNPCAEEPLPAYGACNLGSINLCAFVVRAFTPAARIAEDAIAATTRVAVRFLDDVIDLTRFPLARQQQQARRSRRIGLGITGLADTLAMLGLRYDSEAGRQLAAHLMGLIRDTAYETSIELAAQKGAFPALDVARYLERPFIAALPEAMRAAIRSQGIRNSHLTAIAPAGTISLLAANVSSGIEPIFGIESLRRVLDPQGNYHNFQTTDYAYAIWRAQHPTAIEIPDSFIAGDRMSPADQLSMVSALQPSVDGSISKTVLLPEKFARDAVPTLLETAYELGVKGCAVYRAQARTGVLADRRDAKAASALEAGDPSCVIDRECD